MNYLKYQSLTNFGCKIILYSVSQYEERERDIIVVSSWDFVYLET